MQRLIEEYTETDIQMEIQLFDSVPNFIAGKNSMTMIEAFPKIFNGDMK